MAVSLERRMNALLALERREVALVRALLARPGLIEPEHENALRTAISLARLHRVAGPRGEVDVEELVLPLRLEVLRLLDAAGLGGSASGLSSAQLVPVAKILREEALTARARLEEAHRASLGPEILDREVRTRALVLALGGGGGTGYGYLGAFRLLERAGLRPSLIAGTSMGAMLGLYRASSLTFESADALRFIGTLAWRTLFRPISVKSKYGLPAALSLRLRSVAGAQLLAPSGRHPRLNELPIPLVACAAGIRAGVLPRSLAFYEGLLGDAMLLSNPAALLRRLPIVLAAVMELVKLADRFDAVRMGLDPGTERLDALDAVGFSSSLPGVIHYDIEREEPEVHALLDTMMSTRKLFRLTDGGLVDNVPAQTAWLAVQSGMIGTRNAVVVALDGFSPRLSTPLWMPLELAVRPQVLASCAHAHIYRAMKAALRPTELVPGTESALRMLDEGERELAQDLPLLRRLLAPLARLV